MRRGRGADEKPRRNRQNLIGFLQIVFCAEQSNIPRSQAAATFRKRDVVIEVEVLG